MSQEKNTPLSGARQSRDSEDRWVPQLVKQDFAVSLDWRRVQLDGGGELLALFIVAWVAAAASAARTAALAGI